MIARPAPQIALIDVVKAFGTGPAAIDHVTLNVDRGEVFGVIGESGAGKSTLIRLMNLLERPSSGRVLLEGQDLTVLAPGELRLARRRIGMIFQHFNLLDSRTVAQNVALPLQLEGRLKGSVLKRRVADRLDQVGLSQFSGAYPAQLSGGQKQRVGIARSLACEPKVLLCDEATSALDPETTVQVLDLLAQLNRDMGLTIVLVTHEMDAVRRICDRVAVLAGGRVVETGDVLSVFLKATDPVTRRLLSLDEGPASRVDGARTFSLTWRGAVSAQAFLSTVARETKVDFQLRSGRIDEIKGEPFGQLVVGVQGSGVEAAMAQLQGFGVDVQEVSA